MRLDINVLPFSSTTYSSSRFVSVMPFPSGVNVSPVNAQAFTSPGYSVPNAVFAPPARLVEDDLTDLTVLMYSAPNRRTFCDEIQRAARSIHELKVERLSRDLLGGRVSLILFA
jgi:hypothetical protein